MLALAKRLGREHGLARAQWVAGGYEARLAASPDRTPRWIGKGALRAFARTDLKSTTGAKS